MKRFFAFMLSVMLVLSLAPISYADNAAEPEKNVVSKIVTVPKRFDLV